MQIANFISKITKRPFGKCTVMTNQQCIDVATNIGRDFVDISKSGQELSNDVIINVVRKHLPCIPTPRIVSCEDDVINIAQKYNLNTSVVLSKYKRNNDSVAIAWYSPDLKAICLPAENKEARNPEVLAHELEHLFNRLYSFAGKKDAIKYGFRKLRVLLAPFSFKAGKPLPAADIQKTMFERFGIYRDQIEKVEGLPSNKEGIRQFLTSDSFTNMKDDKRLDAYLRAISRHYIHPTTGNVNVLKWVKRLIEEESRAYTVTDNVLRYKDNMGQEITKQKIRAVLLERLGKILGGEINIARKYKYGILESPSVKKTGLPSEIYKG